MNVETFWSKVDKSGDCWVWRGGLNKAGYGQALVLPGETYAHRVSFVLTTGVRIPRDLEIMHSCDNPPCVNPDHLTLATHQENIADREAKGRGRYGPNAPHKMVA